jgi:hypothetical protein
VRRQAGELAGVGHAGFVHEFDSLMWPHLEPFR